MIYVTANSPKDWCKFDVMDETSFIIVSSMIVCKFILVYLFLRSLFIRHKHHIQLSSQEKKIYIIITIWLTIAFLRSALNIIVYFIYQSDDTKRNLKSQLYLSSLCLFMQKMRSFVLHTLLIYICYIWVKNIMLKVEGKKLDLEKRRQIDFIFRILGYIRRYFIVRFVIIAINLGFDIYMIIKSEIGQYSKYLTIISMFQAGLVILIYSFGLWSFQKYNYLLDFPKKLILKVYTQYTLLMGCCIARLIFDLLFFIFLETSKHIPEENCRVEQPVIPQYFHLTLGYLTMHILPVAIVLMVYWPQIEQESKSEEGSSIEDDDIDNRNRFIPSDERQEVTSGQI